MEPEASSARITDVSTRLVSVPFDRPLGTAVLSLPAIDTVIVEVRTDAGVKGIGWCFAVGTRRARALKATADDLGGLLVGHDPFHTGELWERMREAVALVGRRGIAALAMAALDTACWDVVGRCLDQPLYRLLGAVRREVEVYASGGLWLDRSRQELEAEAGGYISDGFHAVKLRLGLADEAEDLERVRIVREAIGPDATLMVDVNQGWSVKQAIRMGKRLEEHDVFWLEEPIPHEDVAGTAQVAAAVPMNLCTGESYFLKEDFLHLLRERGADIYMPDLMRMGGITEWMKVARLCEAHRVPVTPHLFTEASSHLLAACPNGVWQEHMPWWEPLLTEPVKVRDGVIRLTDRPGIGVDFDEAAIRRFEVA